MRKERRWALNHMIHLKIRKLLGMKQVTYRIAATTDWSAFRDLDGVVAANVVAAWEEPVRWVVTTRRAARVTKWAGLRLGDVLLVEVVVFVLVVHGDD